MKTCTNCKTQTTDDAVFCPRCGTQVGTIANGPTIEAGGHTSYGDHQVNPVNPPVNPYNPSPFQAPPPLPQPTPPPVKRGTGGIVTILISICIVFLLIISLVVVYVTHSQPQPPASVVVSATATPAATATPTSIATTLIPTATATSADPYGGTLQLSDPMSAANTAAFNWNVVQLSYGSCEYLNGAYDVSAPASGGIECGEAIDFSNFAFQITMEILKGDTGGFTFRKNTTDNTRYVVYIGENGGYSLARNSGNQLVYLVQPVKSLYINTGYNVTNTIAVVAKGSNITLYINGSQVASVIDSTWNHGRITLDASPYRNSPNPTEVLYSNAMMWTL